MVTPRTSKYEPDTSSAFTRSEAFPRVTLACLLGAFTVLTLAVGSQADRVAPATAFALIGRFDQSVFSAAQHINHSFLTPLAKTLNFLGGGTFSIPFRAGCLILLLGSSAGSVTRSRSR